MSENWEGCCGRRVLAGGEAERAEHPPAGCDARANEAPGQKPCRPEGFRVQGRRAALLPAQRRLRVSFPLSSHLAVRPRPRKQHPSEFSDSLLGIQPAGDCPGITKLTSLPPTAPTSPRVA